jgi:signal transduction histidine kinase
MLAIALFDALDVLACVFDRSTLEIHDCSRPLAQLLGRETSAELTGRVVIDVFTPESFETFERYLLERDFSSSALCSLRVPDGGETRVAVSIYGVEDDGDDGDSPLVTMICLPVRDDRATVAELTTSIHTLSQQNERLRDFTKLIGHDLRNPLHVVISSVDLVKAWQGGTLEVRAGQQLDRIQRAGHAMNSILDGVIKYFRFEVGEYPMELTDINALVDGVVKMLPDLDGRGLNIHRTDDLPSLVCERQLIYEVFQNVVNNAIGYSDKDPVEIEIGMAEAEGRTPVFFVRDNGVGIAEADLSRVFAPFGRADRKGLNVKGTGMGMTLVKKIVERHGGRIWLESQVNLGTTVHFSLSEHPRPGG